MNDIQYINDKTKIYLYEILSKKRKLAKKENEEFNKLKSIRVYDERERNIILQDLKSKGYITQPNGSLIRKSNGHEFHGSLPLTNLEVTKAGEELLKKELKSEYYEEKHRIRMEWIDRLIDFKTIIFSILSAIAGLFLREIFSLIESLYQWILRLLSPG